MKLMRDELQLTGKGFRTTTDWLNENIKIVAEDIYFHELVVAETQDRIGWIIPETFSLLADMTAHTPDGMRGRSTNDKCIKSLVIDPDNLLADIIPDELEEIDVSESKTILDKLLEDQKGMFGNTHFDGDGLIIVSTSTGVVFVQAEDTSVRIKDNEGIMVLKRKDEGQDSLTTIDSNDGIFISSEDKQVRIGSDGIVINGEPLNFENMMAKVSKSIKKAFTGKKFNFDFDFDFGESRGFDDFDDSDEFDVNISFE